MGICDSSNEGRIIRLTKKSKYQFNDNKPKKKLDSNTSKSFQQFKIKEINCENFYNINNNYNYSISNNNDKEQNNESINGLKLMNQPIQNLTEEKIANNDTYQKLLSYFKSKVNQYPYNSLSEKEILILENEYIENKMISPYKFIENQNYGKLFNKIYELCFLKCEPLLNNINNIDSKGINLLFYRTVIILLRENNFEKYSEDIINSFFELSYDNNSNYINKEKFNLKIKSFCEICYQIIFYFYIASNQFTEDQYFEYLNNQNVLINDKYSNVDIDNFCISLLFENDKDNLKLEEIIEQWFNYICKNINSDNCINNNNYTSIKNKMKEMLNPFHLFEILAGVKLSAF